MLEDKIKALCLEKGAIRAGIARREAFSEAPPSADMRYIQPWANAVVAFAVDLGTEWMGDFFGKKSRMGLRRVHFDTHQKVGRIGTAIEDMLKRSGFEAQNIIHNGIYRFDHSFEKEIPDPDLKPPLSLRYMAVGAGIGRFGWSGNVLAPGAWSNVFLGGVVTDALLEPDNLLEEDLCEDCRICARVCPSGFIHPKEEVRVIIGGREHVYNNKRGDYRCLIPCAGFSRGLSRDGTWSSWSTGRSVLPEDDSLLPDFYARLRDDPANSMARRLTKFGTRGILDRSFENTNPVCAHCSAVCSGPRDHRKAMMKLLFSSGIVERNPEGQEITVKHQSL